MPLFPALMWSRPETKQSAGKLLVIGGHAQSFAAPARAYTAATAAGAGSVRVLLPDRLEKTVHTLFPTARYAPSNPSGSFAMTALGELLAAAEWSSGVLVAGDTGRNSETAAMLEHFAQKYTGQLTLVNDAADLVCSQPQSFTSRADTLAVLNLGQLQQLGVQLQLPYAFTSELGLFELVQRLHNCTTTHPNLFVVTQHQQHAVAAVQGQISTTVQPHTPEWRIRAAAAAATWWLQTPTKPFEAITSSLLS